MSINPIDLKLTQIKPIQRPDDLAPKPQVKEGGPSFSQMFANAIKEVDQMQKEADNQIEGLVSGNENVTTHGAMLALEKADTAFQLMNSIRAKIVRVYEDVLRTQV